jgi:LysR family transcriptional regulator, low CO2-responsive transcriptional regulator
VQTALGDIQTPESGGRNPRKLGFPSTQRSHLNRLHATYSQRHLFSASVGNQDWRLAPNRAEVFCHHETHVKHEETSIRLKRSLTSTAISIADDRAAFEQRINVTTAPTRGKVKVAIVISARYFVQRLVGACCAKNPNIVISLEVLNLDGFAPRVRDNQIDRHIMSMPPTEINLDGRTFVPNPWVIIAVNSNPFNERGELEPDDPSKQRVILHDRDSRTRIVTKTHFKRLQFKPNLRLGLVSHEAMKEDVVSHLGVAVVSSHALRVRAS